jgi:Phosphopantetheinyl transferase
MTIVSRRGSFASFTESEVLISAPPWQPASAVPALENANVHVWLAHITSLAHSAPRFDALMTANERARGDAYLDPADRLRHVVTRGVLRTLASHYAGAPPAALRFSTGPFGKPRLVAPNASALTFNLSHSGDIVLLAFACHGEVGVDVEHWSARLGEEERTRIGESVFSQAERSAISRLHEAVDRERAFYTLWSRKEAYLKGTGAGISGGLSHVDLSVDESARIIEDRNDASAIERWTLRDLDVGAGYSAAHAFTPPGQEVVLLTPSHHLFDS